MRTPSAKAKPAPSLRSVINATKKLWRQYHLSYDQHATGADHQAGISASPPALCADDTARTRDADRAVSNVSWTLKASDDAALCSVKHGDDAGELSAGVGTVMASSHAVEIMTAEELRRGKPWLNLMKPNRKKRPDGQHSEPHTIRNRRHIGRRGHGESGETG